MMDLENAPAFSQVLRCRNLRQAPARRKTEVQNLPPATNNANRFRYRRRKVRNHNGFGLFLCEFLLLNLIDILHAKRLWGELELKIIKNCVEKVIGI